MHAQVLIQTLYVQEEFVVSARLQERVAFLKSMMMH